MTLSDIGILAVWHALSGGELRGRRGVAFWRGGDGYSVSLNPERGTWYDFRDGIGGGVLALVENPKNLLQFSRLLVSRPKSKNNQKPKNNLKRVSIPQVFFASCCAAFQWRPLCGTSRGRTVSAYLR